MEIKMKLGEVLNINQTLKNIIDNSNDVDVLFKFKLLGIMKAFENHVTNFDIIRNSKIMEYGEKTDDGNIHILEDNRDAIEKFNKDMNTVINSDVVVNIEKLKVTDVFNKGVRAEFLTGLYPIIEE